MDGIILSPEYNNTGRREALANGGVTIETGALCKYVGDRVSNVNLSDTTMGMTLIAVENTANSGGIDYTYVANENVFLQSLPKGALVRVRAAADSYPAGTEVEIGGAGFVQPFSAGDIKVGVVPSFGGETLSEDGVLMIEIY